MNNSDLSTGVLTSALPHLPSSSSSFFFGQGGICCSSSLLGGAPATKSGPDDASGQLETWTEPWAGSTGTLLIVRYIPYVPASNGRRVWPAVEKTRGRPALRGGRAEREKEPVPASRRWIGCRSSLDYAQHNVIRAHLEVVGARPALDRAR